MSKLDEFDGQRGERQQRGDARVYGLGAPREPGQVGLSPPANLQVQSVFDTRPIAAFDFAFSLVGDFGGALSAVFTGQQQAPNGYTAVLRRVEVEVTPPLLNAGPDGVVLMLTRDDSSIQNNEVVIHAPFVAYTWETHHVFGFWQRFGLRAMCGAPPPMSPPSKLVARFFGTLIPSRSLPYPDEIASGPVVTTLDAKT